MLRKPNRYKCFTFDGISVRQVIVASLVVGKGIEGDPIRHAEVFYDEKGNFIFALDEGTRKILEPYKYENS